jgi:hypothetical protein
MNLNLAIKKVGKAMAKAKFNRFMGGAMLPHGDIGTAGTVSAIFGISYKEADTRLSGVMSAEYKKICDEHYDRVRKIEAKYWQNKERKKK